MTRDQENILRAFQGNEIRSLIRTIYNNINNDLANYDNNSVNHLTLQQTERLIPFPFSELNYKFEGNFYTICPISLEQLNNDTIICELPCGHYFVESNIKEWLLTRSNACPTCRTVVNI